MPDLTITRISGNSGASGADITLQRLTADSAINSTLVPSVVMTTTGLGSGTWKYSYLVAALSAATTTGMSIFVNFTGTVTVNRFKMRREYLGTGGNQTTGSLWTATGSNTGVIIEGFAHKTNNTDPGPNAGFSNLANGLMVVEGFAETTSSGSLELKIASEVDTSGVRIMAASNLILEKVA